MKRVMLAAVVIGVAFLLTVCKGNNRGRGDWDDIKKQGPNESADLGIALRGTRCALTQDPQQIRAVWDHRVRFTIRGSCNAQDKITIGRFEPDGEPFDSVTPVDAQEGQVLIVKVKQQGKKDRGLWHYQVLVNNTALDASSKTQSRILNLFEPSVRAADFFDFAICPSWPCN